jgi:hypothetical protein
MLTTNELTSKLLVGFLNLFVDSNKTVVTSSNLSVSLPTYSVVIKLSYSRDSEVKKHLGIVIMCMRPKLLNCSPNPISFDEKGKKKWKI